MDPVSEPALSELDLAEIDEAFASAERTMPSTAALRQRVAALGEPPPRSAEAGRLGRSPRTLFLATAAAIVVVAGAGALIGLRSDRSTPEVNAADDEAVTSVPATSTSSPPASVVEVESTETSPAPGPEIEPVVEPDQGSASQPSERPFAPSDRTDDPNPPGDGSQGRLPVSVNPVPLGFPTPETTGLAVEAIDVEGLRPIDGLRITEPTVLEGVEVSGSIVIASSNVTIRNSRVTSSGTYAVHVEAGVENVVIENTRIRAVGTSVSAALYLQSPATVTGVDLSGGFDNIKATAGFTLEASYLSGVNRRPESGLAGSNIRAFQGSDVVIRGNSIIAPWQSPSGNAIFVGADSGPMRRALVTSNYLSGGAITVLTGQDDHPFEDVTISGNRIEAGSWSQTWIANRAGATVADNQQLDS